MSASFTVTLPAQFDVRVVSELHQRFLEGVHASHTLINGEQVERCDAAGAQLLLAVARKESGEVRWQLSSALLEQLSLFGVDVSLFASRDGA